MKLHDIAGDCGGAVLIPLARAFPHTSSVTLWRWRQKGWLVTTNISGRQYVSADNLSAFNRRAAAGEFSKEHVAPKRTMVAPA